MGKTTAVIFVCHGNICRSTMAEYVMKFLVGQHNVGNMFEIDSAGTSREEEGNPVHPGTVAKLRSAGIPVGNHRARKITPADFYRFDYIIGMDSANIRNLERMCPDPALSGKIYKLLSFTGSGADIADPWYTGNFDDTFRDVMAGCSAFLSCISRLDVKN